jgi:NAD(P)-dependent dehydrogenase (short-subunit alcohol dehydrogenase family)
VAFNNAGTEGAFAPIGEQTEALFDETIKINLKGAFLSLKYEAAVMKTGSSIILTRASRPPSVSREQPYMPRVKAE